MEWAIHEDRVISCVLWKDKCLVVLLSTHATSICAPCEIRDTTSRRQSTMQTEIFTSPMLVEYTKHMRGVDMADQRRASYSSQTRSHKWWHRVFWFLIDTIIVNMYVMYFHV